MSKASYLDVACSVCFGQNAQVFKAGLTHGRTINDVWLFRLDKPLTQNFSDTRYRDVTTRNGTTSRYRCSVINFTSTHLDDSGSFLMVDSGSQSEHVGEVETAILDAELFVKYRSPERAIERLRTALERHSRSIPLRERLREISAANGQASEAARQCLFLANLYIEREDLNTAHDRLLEAKHLDTSINIAGGLEAIRRARRPDLKPPVEPVEQVGEKRYATLAGDLAAISIFDAIQVVENAKLTGFLTLTGESKTGRVFFNEGTIVDAESGGSKGEAGFRQIVEITNGSFEFEKTAEDYPIVIQALTNTNLLLDTLRQLDEEKQ